MSLLYILQYILLWIHFSHLLPNPGEKKNQAQGISILEETECSLFTSDSVPHWNQEPRFRDTVDLREANLRNPSG